MRGSQAHSSPFLKSMKFQQKKKKKKRRKREIKRKIYLEHRTNRTLSKDKTKKKNLRKIYNDTYTPYTIDTEPPLYISSYLSLRGKRKLTAEREKERWRNTQIRKFTRQQNFNEERRIYERLSHSITLGFRFTSLSLSPSPLLPSGRTASSGTERRLSRRIVDKIRHQRLWDTPTPPPPFPVFFLELENLGREGRRGRKDNRAKLAENRRHFRRPALPPRLKRL